MSIVQAKARFLCLFDFGRFMYLKEDFSEWEVAGTSCVRSLSYGAMLDSVLETFCPRQDWMQACKKNRGSEPVCFQQNKVMQYHLVLTYSQHAANGELTKYSISLAVSFEYNWFPWQPPLNSLADMKSCLDEGAFAKSIGIQHFNIMF